MIEISDCLSGRIKETSSIARTLAIKILARLQEIRSSLNQENSPKRSRPAASKAGKKKKTSVRAKSRTAKKTATKKKTKAKTKVTKKARS